MERKDPAPVSDAAPLLLQPKKVVHEPDAGDAARAQEVDARIVARVATMSPAQRKTRTSALKAELGLAKNPGIRADIEKELAVLAEADLVAIDTVPMKSAGGTWLFVAVIVLLAIGTALSVRARQHRDPAHPTDAPRDPPAAHSR